MKSIVIMSGFGGEHKSRLAIYIASIMSYFDKKVLLVDTDFNTSGASIKLGVDEYDDIQDVVTVSSILMNNLAITKVMGITLPVSFKNKESKDVSFDILPAHDFHTDNYNLDTVENLEGFTRRINELVRKRGYDLVVYDCCSGISNISLHLATCSDKVLLLSDFVGHYFRLMGNILKSEGLDGKTLCVITQTGVYDKEDLDKLAYDLSGDKPQGFIFYKESLPFDTEIEKYCEISKIFDLRLAGFAYSIVRELFSNKGCNGEVELGPELSLLYDDEIIRATELNIQIGKITRNIWYKLYTWTYFKTAALIFRVLVAIGFTAVVVGIFVFMFISGKDTNLSDREYSLRSAYMTIFMLLGFAPGFIYSFIWSRVEKIMHKAHELLHEVTQVTTHLSIVLGEDVIKSLGLYRYISK